MRILWITPYFPYPPKSGGISSILKKIEFFYKLGYKIHLYSITNREILKSEVEFIKKYVENIYCVKRYSGFKLISNLLDCYLKKESLFLSLIPEKFKENLKIEIDKFEYDFVFCEHTYMGYWFNLFFSEYKNTIITVHNIEYNWYRFMRLKEKNISKRVYYYIEERAFCKYEDFIFKNKNNKFFFLNNSEMQNVIEKYNSQTRSILIPGIPLYDKSNNIEFRIKEKSSVIAFISRLDSVRNINGLVYFIEEVYPKIVKEFSSVKLHVIGKGDKGEIEKYIRNSKFSRNINFIGEVDELSEAYFNAKIIIIPILESIGIQTKLYEAINYNSLVVTTREGVKGSVFEDEKGVVVVKDSMEFSDICLRILRNEYDFDVKYNEIEKKRKIYGELALGNMVNKFLRGI